ncbi:hypothetical protein HK405_013627 [Cladochytrium tenue]|nr:hypothetical protein HK405_013627 [Cladochytrium tenue]
MEIAFNLHHMRAVIVWRNPYYPLDGPPRNEAERKKLAAVISAEKEAVDSAMRYHVFEQGQELTQAADQNCADVLYAWRRCVAGRSLLSGRDMFCNTERHRYRACVAAQREILATLGYSSYRDAATRERLLDRADALYQERLRRAEDDVASTAGAGAGAARSEALHSVEMPPATPSETAPLLLGSPRPSTAAIAAATASPRPAPFSQRASPATQPAALVMPPTGPAASTAQPPQQPQPPPPQQQQPRIEPKVFFANERTFLSWLHFCIVLGSLALGLMNFGDRVGQIAGFGFTLVALAFLGYSLYLYQWRARKIRERDPGPYDDLVGPVILVGVICTGDPTRVAPEIISAPLTPGKDKDLQQSEQPSSAHPPAKLLPDTTPPVLRPPSAEPLSNTISTTDGSNHNTISRSQSQATSRPATTTAVHEPPDASPFPALPKAPDSLAAITATLPDVAAVEMAHQAPPAGGTGFSFTGAWKHAAVRGTGGPAPTARVVAVAEMAEDGDDGKGDGRDGGNDGSITVRDVEREETTAGRDIVALTNVLRDSRTDIASVVVDASILNIASDVGGGDDYRDSRDIEADDGRRDGGPPPREVRMAFDDGAVTAGGGAAPAPTATVVGGVRGLLQMAGARRRAAAGDGAGGVKVVRAGGGGGGGEDGRSRGSSISLSSVSASSKGRDDDDGGEGGGSDASSFEVGAPRVFAGGGARRSDEDPDRVEFREVIAAIAADIADNFVNYNSKGRCPVSESQS